MADREQQRLGDDGAATMVEVLDPVGRTDVATTHDLDALLTGTGIQTAVVGLHVTSARGRSTVARPHERGQAMPLLLVVLFLVVLAAVLVAEVGTAAIEREEAQVAADAAALAGAAEGRAAADAAAEANGARVTAYHDLGVVVQLSVTYRRATATAAAEASVVPEGPGDRAGLAPVVVAALARADALLGAPIPVVSGFRSAAEQQALWDARASNPYPVARPGTSLHEAGLAVDVPRDLVPSLLVVASEAGLCQPLPQTDPVHFEPCPPTSPR